MKLTTADSIRLLMNEHKQGWFDTRVGLLSTMPRKMVRLKRVARVHELDDLESRGILADSFVHWMENSNTLVITGTEEVVL